MMKPNDVVAVVLTVLILGAFITFYACVYRVRAAAAAAAASDEDEDEGEGEDDDGYVYGDEYYGARSSGDDFLSTSTDSAHVGAQVGAQVPRPEPAVLRGDAPPCAYADPAFASAGSAEQWRDRGDGSGVGDGEGDGAMGADTGASANAGGSTSAESPSSDARSAGAAGSVSSPQVTDEENRDSTG